MKERPILFNAEMVRAILDGRKTQTRRPVKHIPALGIMDDWCHKVYQEQFAHIVGDYRRFCPFGQPGDRLWTRETWRVHESYDSLSPRLVAIATGGDFNGCIGYLATPRQGSFWGKTRPSIHMPRWASRIDLEVTDVRVGRVQEISHADCVAEGVEVRTRNTEPGCYLPVSWAASKACYAISWDDIYVTKGLGWNANPWVWVVDFKVTP